MTDEPRYLPLDPLLEPHAGSMLCWECGGRRSCQSCGGDGVLDDGRRCFMCGGSRYCSVCAGAGEVPLDQGPRDHPSL